MVPFKTEAGTFAFGTDTVFWLGKVAVFKGGGVAPFVSIGCEAVRSIVCRLLAGRAPVDDESAAGAGTFVTRGVAVV